MCVLVATLLVIVLQHTSTETNNLNIPNKDELKANINKTSDFVLFADVSFFKVYPLPDCILVANQEKINTNVTVEEEAKIGHFYKIQLHLVCEIHNITCMNSVAVLCIIGKDEMVVHNTNISTCPGSVTSSIRSAIPCSRCWEIIDNGNGEESELTPLLKSNSDTSNDDWCYNTKDNHIIVPLTSRQYTTIPAHNYKDVTDIVYYGIGHDKSYIPTFISNFKIQIANLRKYVLRLKAFRNLSKMPFKGDKCKAYQSYGPAQAEKDVNNMITYAKISDKVFAEKLASDALINSRRQKTIPSSKPCPSVPAPPCTNVSVSDIDVIKGSSMIPTWGARKRSRISITGKQESSNE